MPCGTRIQDGTHRAEGRIRRISQLTIVDDGIGMEEGPELCTKQGFGLENMRERAGAIGGQWTLVSKPGQGTLHQRARAEASAQEIN